MRKVHNFPHSVKSNQKEYSAYKAMLRRCLNPKSKDYHRYGGRGISVCESWLKSFSSFLNDLGKSPSQLHSLDRIENNGNYEPSNCRWATKNEQQNNMRSNVLIEYSGEIKTLKTWCNNLNIKYHLVYLRMYKLNWPFELAISLPSDPTYNPMKRKKYRVSINNHL